MNKILLYLCLVMISPYMMAAECTRQEAMDSEATAAYIKSWQELEAHVSKHGHCDDGAIAEGYSESVSYLMETQWQEFLEFKMTDTFSNFILRHIDSTWDTNRLNNVSEQAEKNCSETKRTICDAIIETNENGF